MIRLSVCLNALFRGKDHIEMLRSVKATGLDTVEFWSWRGRDLEKLLQAKQELDINLLGFLTDPISLVDESKRDPFLQTLSESIDAATMLGASNLIVLTGDTLPNVSREQQKLSVIDGLRAGGELAEKAGITLLVEPLNTKVDHKGYFLSQSEEAFEIVQKVDNRYVKVLFDIYHQQVTEGNILRRILSNMEWIGHFHAAGVPERNEIDKGEIHYPNLFEVIGESGYTGYVGLEYFTANDPFLGLREASRMIR